MADLHPEYVLDDKQRRKAVMLSVAEWEQVVSELEELDDIRAYDKAKSGEGARIPFDQAVRELGEDHDG